ncbi:MAG: hypothetical protein Q7T96_18335 [Methylobacter sp.]|nr:hypothetical protein [Methylobacter sp.]
MKLIKVPGPTRLLCGAALAYWLAHIINPAFVAIAVMIALFIPVFMTDYFASQLVSDEINQKTNQSSHSVHQPINAPTPNRLQLLGKQSSSEFLKDGNETEVEDKQPLSQRAKLTK